MPHMTFCNLDTDCKTYIKDSWSFFTIACEFICENGLIKFDKVKPSGDFLVLNPIYYQLVDILI
jgi:hypothetical protein